MDTTNKPFLMQEHSRLVRERNEKAVEIGKWGDQTPLKALDKVIGRLGQVFNPKISKKSQADLRWI